MSSVVSRELAGGEWNATLVSSGVVTGGSDVGTGEKTRSGKVCCGDCGFVVNPIGHKDRCGIGWTRTSVLVKTLAWYGDAMLRVDVRHAVLAVGGRVDGQRESLLVSNETLAEAYTSVMPLQLSASLVSAGEGKHARATVVEASYAVSHDYRCRLMAWLSLPPPLWLGCANTPVAVYVAGSEDAELFGPELDGYCYLWLVRADVWYRVAKAVGAYPEVGAVLRLGDELLEAAPVVVSSRGGVYHVTGSAAYARRGVRSLLSGMNAQSRVGGAESQVVDWRVHLEALVSVYGGELESDDCDFDLFCPLGRGDDVTALVLGACAECAAADGVVTCVVDALVAVSARYRLSSDETELSVLVATVRGRAQRGLYIRAVVSTLVSALSVLVRVPAAYVATSGMFALEARLLQ